MKATTRIKANLMTIEETISTANDLLVNATIEKIVVSERAWLNTFGSYDATAGKVIAKRKMQLSGIPVEFGEVTEAELVVSMEVEAEPVAKASKK
jgi:hypothetical protein